MHQFQHFFTPAIICQSQIWTGVLAHDRSPDLAYRGVHALADKGDDTHSLQAYLGHKNIQHPVRYTELSPAWFKDFWRSQDVCVSLLAVNESHVVHLLHGHAHAFMHSGRIESNAWFACRFGNRGMEENFRTNSSYDNCDNRESVTHGGFSTCPVPQQGAAPIRSNL